MLNARDFQNLQTAFSAAAGNSLVIPHGAYQVSSALSVPSNTEILTDGPATIISNAGAPILDLTGASNVRISGALTLQGCGSAYDGYPSSQVADLNQVGIKISGADRIYIDGVTVKNIAGSGIDFQNSPAWQRAVQISNFHIRDCYRGVYCRNAGEYAQFANGHIANCTFGAHVDSGNNAFVGCNAVFCSIGFKISGGANNGHGVFSACISDHNTYNLVCQNVSNGETFSGCHFIAGQGGSDHGGIQILNSQGITFTGGQIAFADVSIDASSQVGWRGVALRSGVAASVDAGGILDAKDSLVMPGASVTLNGAAWAGNN